MKKMIKRERVGGSLTVCKILQNVTMLFQLKRYTVQLVVDVLENCCGKIFSV